MQCVLTAVGVDRPGIVEDVSEFVSARGGSIEDSRMVNLHGQFALAIAISGTETTIGAIQAGLSEFECTTHMQAQLTALDNPQSEKTTRSDLYRLSGHALDQAGLVHQVSRALRGLDVNIESLETSLEPAPVTGTPIFAMDLLIALPDQQTLGILTTELGRICDRLNIDWCLEPA